MTSQPESKPDAAVSPPIQPIVRRLPIGAELQPGGGVHFRVWAPTRKRVDVVLADNPTPHPLERDEDGYFAGFVASAAESSRYRYRLDGGDQFPDPASRFQPEGPHGPSQVVNPGRYQWNDGTWRGLPLLGQVLYEIHIGAFTHEGDWAGAAAQLPALADTGITVLEVMPICEFPGNFGWGYDGVDLFAPSHLYGQPDDFRRFVDLAHRLGIAVILDVVYNHLGPDGNYLAQFSRDYFSTKHKTDWGEAINFDGKNNGPVREFFLANASYWIDEYHLDGLRLDATQDIYDDGTPHIMAEVCRQVHSKRGNRQTIIVGENEPQKVKLVRPLDQGGYGLDALWNDDFHHSAMVRLTGRNDSYYTDYLGTPQEFISAMKYGYLYQGQWYKWQKNRRGTSSFGVPPAAFISFTQNHDQIANSARGMRVHQLTAPGLYKALTALHLLGPGTPMLFMGQEFCASTPFLYFADHEQALAELVRQGRHKFMRQWRAFAEDRMMHVLADPHDPHTFEQCRLDHSEREKHAGMYAFHRDLLRMRREDPVLHPGRALSIDGAVLSQDALLLRYFAKPDSTQGDRLLIVNFGVNLCLYPAPEPLLAPPEDMQWRVMWSSENPLYGGVGTPAVETQKGWTVPGWAAVVLAPSPRQKELPTGEKPEDV